MSYLDSKGWLTRDERQFLYETAGALGGKGATLINVGVEYGASVHCMLEGSPQSTVIAIDVDCKKYVDGPKSDKLFLWETPSILAARNWTFGKSPFIFIDGDHSLQGVMKDLEYFDLLLPNGIIAFHDVWAWPPEPKGTIHKIVPDVHTAVMVNWRRPGTWKNFSKYWEEIPQIDSIQAFRKKS